MTDLNEIYGAIEQENALLLMVPGATREAGIVHDYGKHGGNTIFVKPEAITGLHDLRTKLVHEWGHCASGAYHKTYSPYETVERMETRAWRASIRRYLPFEELDYYVSVCGMTPEDIAQQVGFTEDFVARAIEYYAEACGYRFRRYYWG